MRIPRRGRPPPDGYAPGTRQRQATRDAPGADAFVYLPTGKPVTVNLSKISGGKAKAWWFDPRTGEATAIGVLPAQGPKAFDPPGEPGRGNDWVLVLDDATKGYAVPGGER